MSRILNIRAPEGIATITDMTSQENRQNDWHRQEEKKKHQENLKIIKNRLYDYLNEPIWEKDFGEDRDTFLKRNNHNVYDGQDHSRCMCKSSSDARVYQNYEQALFEEKKRGHKWVVEHLPILESNNKLAEYVVTKAQPVYNEGKTLFLGGYMVAFEQGKKHIEAEEKVLTKQKEEEKIKLQEMIAEREKEKLIAIEREALRRIIKEQQDAKKVAEEVEKEVAILAKMAELKTSAALKARFEELSSLF